MARFRRTYFHIDFLEQLGGVKTDIPVTIRQTDGADWPARDPRDKPRSATRRTSSSPTSDTSRARWAQTRPR